MSFIQGVECFDYSHNLNVICTGGVDHAVRLWNPYVTAKPVAIMKGHQSFIIDLAIHEALEQVFSYDKDGVSKKLTSMFRAVLSQCPGNFNLSLDNKNITYFCPYVA